MPSKTSHSPKQSSKPQPAGTSQASKPRPAKTPATNPLPLSENPLKKRISRRTLIKLLIATLIIVALLGYLAWDIIATEPLMTLLTSRDQLVEAVNS